MSPTKSKKVRSASHDESFRVLQTQANFSTVLQQQDKQLQARHERLIAPPRFLEGSNAKKPSSAKPTPVQPFIMMKVVEDPMATVVPSDARSAIQPSSERGRDMWDEGNRIHDYNEN